MLLYAQKWFDVCQGNEEILSLDGVNAYKRAIQYQQLEKVANGQSWKGFLVQVLLTNQQALACITLLLH